MYLGDIYFKQGKKELALKYLTKVDSVVFSENYFFPGLKANYELLIEYYKEKKDAQNQLLYIDKLLDIDDKLDADVTYLSTKINKDYTTPNLIKEKERIIDSLKNKSKKHSIVLISLSLLTTVLIISLVWYYKKQNTYKKRFQELLRKAELNKENNTVASTKTKSLNISKEIINDVLQKLETFEEKKGFLQIDLSVNSLAKQFDTNSKYFSKIVNTYKNKSFTNYINELRINYVIEELKRNSRFRKYTIKAIANEIGFNTTEAFSKSFHKTTGIYPSFFIKELEKHNYL